MRLAVKRGKVQYNHPNECNAHRGPTWSSSSRGGASWPPQGSGSGMACISCVPSAPWPSHGPAETLLPPPPSAPGIGHGLKRELEASAFERPAALVRANMASGTDAGFEAAPWCCDEGSCPLALLVPLVLPATCEQECGNAVAYGIECVTSDVHKVMLEDWRGMGGDRGPM